jgi:hypothetical protein
MWWYCGKRTPKRVFLYSENLYETKLLAKHKKLAENIMLNIAISYQFFHENFS